MAVSKQTKILVNQYDLSRWFKSMKPNFGVDEKEGTNFASGGSKEFKAGLISATLSGEGFYERTAGGTDIESDGILHAALQNALNRVVTIGNDGLALGQGVYMFPMDESKYEIGTQVGELSLVTAEFQAVGKPDRGISLAPLAAASAGGNSASYDQTTVSSVNGAAGHIHCTAISGTGATLTGKVQHSTDGSTWVDLITFTALTAIGAQRVEIATGTPSINRYVRALWTLTGTTPSATFAISFARR